VRYGEVFKAHCFINDMEKTFNTQKVLRIEDHSWVTETGGMIYYLKRRIYLPFFILESVATPTDRLRIGWVAWILVATGRRLETTAITSWAL
jgi:hypothetical protein